MKNNLVIAIVLSIVYGILVAAYYAKAPMPTTTRLSIDSRVDYLEHIAEINYLIPADEIEVWVKRRGVADCFKQGLSSSEDPGTKSISKTSRTIHKTNTVDSAEQ